MAVSLIFTAKDIIIDAGNEAAVTNLQTTTESWVRLATFPTEEQST